MLPSKQYHPRLDAHFPTDVQTVVTFLPAPHGQKTAAPTVPNAASVVQAPTPPESPQNPPLPT